MVTKDKKIEYIIQSVGKSTIVLGGFYVLLIGYVLLVMLFSGGNFSPDLLTLIVNFMLTGGIAALYILLGLKIRRLHKRPLEAMKLIRVVLFASTVLLVFSIIETIQSGASTGILITAVFTAYILWSYIDIRDRIKGKNNA